MLNLTCSCIILFRRSVALPGNGVATFAVSSSGALNCPGENYIFQYMYTYMYFDNRCFYCKSQLKG